MGRWTRPISSMLHMFSQSMKVSSGYHNLNREIDKPKAAGQVRKTLPLEMPKWFLWVSQSLALRRGILFVLCYLEDRSKTGVWELQRPHVFLPTATFFLSLSAVCG